MIAPGARPVVLTRAELDAMREAAEVDKRDPRGNDGVAMVKAVERIIWDRLYVVSPPVTPAPPCRQCGPGYRIGDEGCRHTEGGSDA